MHLQVAGYNLKHVLNVILHFGYNIDLKQLTLSILSLQSSFRVFFYFLFFDLPVHCDKWISFGKDCAISKELPGYVVRILKET